MSIPKTAKNAFFSSLPLFPLLRWGCEERQMMGVVTAKLKFKAVCRCRKCGTTDLSSETNRVEVEQVALSDLHAAIDRALKQPLIQPPIGWSINGRGNYMCPSCV
jgi:hypothetical protein